ncbi:MAG: TolC family protein [Candidatus Hydrogenedentes bacterium]|nr:TolC family protein [Candidatus Hydrogenedentota bacterium]
MLRPIVFTLFLASLLALPFRAIAQESAPPAIEEAETPLESVQAPESDDAPFLPTPANELTLRYGDHLDGLDGDINLREEINIDLIDLEPLRQTLRAGAGADLLQLALQECILIALAENLDIAVTEYEPLKADQDIFSARGEFDPILQSSAIYSRSNQSQSQQTVAFGGISSVESWDTVTNATLAGRLHLGTQYNISWDMQKSESTFSRFVEEHSGQLNLQLTQPLLRGFGLKYNRVRINIARNSKLATQEQLRLTVLQTVSEVIRAYWDLVGAVENLKVRSEALDNAERLLKVNETRQEIGTAADIEVLQAKAGVATRQSDFIAARQSITDASNYLKSLLNLRDGDRFSKALIVPIDRPAPAEPGDFDPQAYEAQVFASIDKALENRPEMTIRQLEIDSAVLEEYRTRRDLMPQLDLIYRYTSGGRDHKLRETLEGIRDRQDYAYAYGFQASVPIFNRTARGSFNRARLTRRQAEVNLEQARQQVMLNVNLATSKLASNAMLVQSNKQATRLQIANVAAEEKRLQLGVTTSWQVLQIQQDLTAAQVQELISNIEYEKARVELELAEGALLDNLGIELDAPEAEDKPVGYWEGLRPRWE